MAASVMRGVHGRRDALGTETRVVLAPRGVRSLLTQSHFHTRASPPDTYGPEGAPTRRGAGLGGKSAWGDDQSLGPLFETHGSTALKSSEAGMGRKEPEVGRGASGGECEPYLPGRAPC